MNVTATVQSPAPEVELPRRSFFASHPVLVDVLVAVGYLVLLLPGLVHQIAFGSVPLAVRLIALITTLLVSAALGFRRHLPLPVLGAVFVLVMVKTLSGYVDPLGLALAAYSTAAVSTSRRAWIALPSVAAATVAVVKLGMPLTGDHVTSPTTNIILLLAAYVPAALIGFLVRARSKLRELERQRFVQSVHERAQAGELRAVRERTALSREMHDVVGHSLTAIINVSDGALRAASVSPESLDAGLRRINSIARDALGETRGILGELRTDGALAPRTPATPVARATPAEQPPGADLGITTLLTTARDTGLATHIVLTGTSRPVREEVRTGLFRIVQEAITNTMRHACHATDVTVTLSYDAHALTVQITDNGAATDASSPGNGLQGIAERARLLGGEATFGPAPTGGWFVTVTIPDREVPGA